MKYEPEFIPMSRAEMDRLGWKELDILLVTGDAYVDHPSFAMALIGRLLLAEGWRVGIVAQPDWKNPDSLKVMGRPRLACAISAGNMDSMLCIYTVGRRFRREDIYSPGGRTGLKPPMASVVYTQLCKAAFPGIPTVLGGMEASMRRVAHYDYWQDKVRPGVLVDSKADILIYGQGELSTPEVFHRIERGEPLDGIPGTVRFLTGKASAEFSIDDSCVLLPSFEEMKSDKDAMMREMIILEREMNAWCGKRLLQDYSGRYLLVEPPQPPMSSAEFDRVCEFPYAWRPHPSYKERIPAFETVRDSIPAVRGCPGGCAFCGLVSHQGRHVISRSQESILRSVERLKKQKFFRGTISDVGGPAGNSYGHHPANPELCKKCRRSSCMFPNHCPNYVADEQPLIRLLRRLRREEGVKHVFINSGIRLDLALMQPELTAEIIRHHVSGHMKVAPEHLHRRVLALMRKGRPEELEEFMRIFERVSRECGKEQYLIPLFISNFPGCTEEEMKVVDDFLASHNWSLEQAQDYIPLPLTMGAAMYYSGKTPDGEVIEVNRGLRERRTQLAMLKHRRDGCRNFAGERIGKNGAEPFRPHERFHNGGKHGYGSKGSSNKEKRH